MIKGEIRHKLKMRLTRAKFHDDMTPSPKFCIALATSDNELAQFNLNFVWNWMVKSSVDKDTNFDLHDPCLRIQDQGCVLFQFVVLNTLHVWFLRVTILIIKYTGEAYCMTESFLLLYWDQNCQANTCFSFQCKYISNRILMRRDALSFSSVIDQQ
jgi:hypothetical protein